MSWPELFFILLVVFVRFVLADSNPIPELDFPGLRESGFVGRTHIACWFSLCPSRVAGGRGLEASTIHRPHSNGGWIPTSPCRKI